MIGVCTLHMNGISPLLFNCSTTLDDQCLLHAKMLYDNIIRSNHNNHIYIPSYQQITNSKFMNHDNNIIQDEYYCSHAERFAMVKHARTHTHTQYTHARHALMYLILFVHLYMYACIYLYLCMYVMIMLVIC